MFKLETCHLDGIYSPYNGCDMWSDTGLNWQCIYHDAEALNVCYSTSRGRLLPLSLFNQWLTVVSGS